MFSRIRVLASLASLAFLFFVSASSANEAGDQLRSVHKARLVFLQTATGFYRLQGSNGDPRHAKEMDEQLAALRDQVAEVNVVLQRYELNEQSSKIDLELMSMFKNLNTALAAIKQNGYVDFSVADAYLKANDAIIQQLNESYVAIENKSGHKVPALAQTLREQSMIMQRMYGMYIERTASSFGYSYRSDQQSDATIDTLAKQFSKNLEELKQAIPVHSELRPTLSSIRTKWEFLEKSFLNYTEKTVPFLVTKFGNQIIVDLNTMADSVD